MACLSQRLVVGAVSKGKWVGNRWFPARDTPTEADLEKARREMEAPIEEQVAEVRGWACDACGHWFADRRGGLRYERPAWLLRYGCPNCGEKELSVCMATYCPRCGALVPVGDEHEEFCV